jgi:Domain of unknown function (DUF5664)
MSDKTYHGAARPSLEGFTPPTSTPPLAKDGAHPADPNTGAMREKLNNVPYDLVPIELIEAAAEALEYGAGKYAPGNWRKGLPILQVCASIIRHCFALMKGEVIDRDSGVSHVSHICANAAFLATYSRSGPWDYRPRDKMVDVPLGK